MVIVLYTKKCSFFKFCIIFTSRLENYIKDIYTFFIVFLGFMFLVITRKMTKKYWFLTIFFLKAIAVCFWGILQMEAESTSSVGFPPSGPCPMLFVMHISQHTEVFFLVFFIHTFFFPDSSVASALNPAHQACIINLKVKSFLFERFVVFRQFQCQCFSSNYLVYSRWEFQFSLSAFII